MEKLNKTPPKELLPKRQTKSTNQPKNIEHIQNVHLRRCNHYRADNSVL